MSIKTKCSYCWENYNLSNESLWKRAKCKVCKNEFIIEKIEDEKNIIEEKKSPEIKEKQIHQKSPDLNIKPNKTSFILFSNPLIIVFFILWFLALFINYFIAIIFFILVFLLFSWENIKFKKEKYILTDRKIIYHNWNLISDNSTEINLDKITEVKASLPFLQHLFFKTWDLYIQTAWAGSSKIRFSNVNNTMDIYEEFRLRMQKNGFHLKKDKLVQSEKPHILWIIWEVFWKIIWTLFVVFYLIMWTIEGLSELWEINNSAIFSIVPILTLIWIIGYITVVFLDLRKRKYEIYSDCVYYKEWFLSKHYSFLPIEAISDVENTQSFFSKIFWLHDIIISSAWASNKVIFKNMINWETMINNLRYLKDHVVMSEKDAIEWEEKSANSLLWFKDKIEEPLDFDKDFEGHYKMNITKTIVETLPFLITWPWFIVILIARLIMLKFTDFEIKKTTIEKKFELFSTKFNSFSIEKITWVQIKQSFIDKWFWTCSIKFWSIGSGTPITFENIKKTKWLEEQILAKVWIRKEEKIKDIEINFSFMNFLKANILLSIFMIILFPITILVFIYKKIYFSENRYFREIYKNYIKTQNWIFFITKKYVLFRHIKWTKSTKYPFTNTWKIYLNVAWEVQVEAKSQWQVLANWAKWSNIWIFSNSVDIEYIKNVFEQHNLMDNILNKKEIDTNIIWKSKQDIINSIFFLSFLAIIISVWITLTWAFIVLVPVLIIFWIFISLIIWFIKVKYWNFEENRVLYGSWIIYKKRQTILYNRFNFIDLKRWFYNKVFKNWTVNIYTIWSSWVDMKVPDSDNYTAIYDLLKKD